VATNKIKSIDELVQTIVAQKAAGRRVVHCHGVFDLLHPGHFRHLMAARREGDVLVVTITADHHVHKGPGRPAFNHHLRAETLAAIEYVDFVAINDAPTAIDLIKRLRPDVYVKGSDYAHPQSDPTGMISEEEHAVHAVGGRIHFTDEIAFSSSALINSHFDVFAPETEAWLKSFRARHSLGEIQEYLERASALRALVIGEPIIDEYMFCRPLGKSSKDPVLAVQYHSMESQAGGTLAIANHLAGMAGQVSLLAEVGELETREDFMVRHLLHNVTPTFLTRRGAPTIHKRRIVDSHTGARLLEIYVMDDGRPHPEDSATLVDAIRRMAPEHDVVVVADYGHGMMTPMAIEAVIEHAPMLVVNAQANAGNRGFNTISKYRRANYICLAAHEAELEARLQNAPIEELLSILQERVDCNDFTITRGASGSIHFSREGDAVQVPSLATLVKDRVGAGDAVLAITSALVALKAPKEVVGFVGNIAGAIAVAELGNRAPVTGLALKKAIIALMK
jgi:rfaE bifunctional protein kinase chain/domain/rfaE bifunctional protein nucleotidyltransferase chain/domain